MLETSKTKINVCCNKTIRTGNKCSTKCQKFNSSNLLRRSWMHFFRSHFLNFCLHPLKDWIEIMLNFFRLFWQFTQKVIIIHIQCSWQSVSDFCWEKHVFIKTWFLVCIDIFETSSSDWNKNIKQYTSIWNSHSTPKRVQQCNDKHRMSYNKVTQWFFYLSREVTW